MTVFLGNVFASRPTLTGPSVARFGRFALLVVGISAFPGMPMQMAAAEAGASQGALQGPQAQSAPVKPSADVPAGTSLPKTPTTNSIPAVEPAARPAQSLDVSFVDGKVTVDAANASLNGVLHGIATKAGIKMTGTVSDEKVFGHYGPATPAAILAMLLDGTASNMLLVDDANGGSQLILTPRVGGPTPPNPLAAALEAAEDQEARANSRYVPPVRPFQPQAPGRGPLAEPAANEFGPGRPGIPSPNRSDPSQTTGDSRTPQQIYDQLQNANQQKQGDTQTPQ